MPDGSVVRHSHGHDDHAHAAGGTLRLDQGPAGTEVAGMSQRRLVAIEQDLMSKNDALAKVNRHRFEQHHIFSLNLMSSPGAGKTTLLVKTLEKRHGNPLAVIEGDQQTDLDARRIRATGVPALQINTGKGCHLDAQMVAKALDALPVADGTTLFIENVGNLVCPAGFDLGEARRVVLVSVTEGEDKPLKYPDVFAHADVVLITKVDLVPHLQFDLPTLRANIERVRPGVKIFELSTTSGVGFDAWLSWLDAQAVKGAVARV
jgi:hydrogenase nickel incorporation protein HypB